MEGLLAVLGGGLRGCPGTLVPMRLQITSGVPERVLGTPTLAFSTKHKSIRLACDAPRRTPFFASPPL